MADIATSHAAPAAGELVQWNINSASRLLGGSKLAQMTVLFLGGPLVVMGAAGIFNVDGVLRILLLVFGVLPLLVCVIANLKQMGALKYSWWRRDLFLLPLAGVGFAFYLILGIAAVRELTPDSPADAVQGAWVFFALGIAGIAGCLWGWRSLWRLRRVLLDPTHTKIADIVRTAERAQAEHGSLTKLGTPVDRKRGYAYSLAAIVWLLIPIPVNGLQLVTCFLIIRARQYFQISADSLLAQDKRQPILFLRSFADDERSGLLWNTDMKLLDFSIESRFANWFMNFGPFIAISSPQATVPQIGAARVRLSDADWQGAVMNWIGTSSAIVVAIGTTHWVDWELSRIIESGSVGKLLLFFPPTPAGWRHTGKAKRQQDQAARLQTVKAAFANSIWAPALEKIDQPDTLVGARFHASGAVTVIRSKVRANDAYHLAAVILYQDMPAPAGDTDASSLIPPAAHVESPPLSPAPPLAPAQPAGDAAAIPEADAPGAVETTASPPISPAADGLPQEVFPVQSASPQATASPQAAVALAPPDAKWQDAVGRQGSSVRRRGVWIAAAVLGLGALVLAVIVMRPLASGPKTDVAKEAATLGTQAEESYGKGDYDRAILDATQAIKLDPGNARSYVIRGLAYYAKDDYDRAIGDFTQAIKLDPTSAAAFYNRGAVYTKRGDDDLAIQDYTQAIALNPRDSDTFLNRGISYHNKGDDDHAIQDFTQAITLNPGDSDTFLKRGILYRNKGDNDHAIQDFTQAIALNAKNAEAFYYRGGVYFGKSDYNRAIADYGQAIAHDPQHAGAFNGRCWARFVIGQLPQGLADCNESLRLRPGDAQTLDSRGWIYFKSAQYDRAIADFNEALRLEPKLATSLYGRGLAKVKKGDRKGGNDDIAAAKGLKNDIVAVFARWNVR